MKNFLFLFFFVLSFNQAIAQSVVRIGCTVACDNSIKIGLKNASKPMAMKVLFLDLSTEKEVKWEELDGVIIPGGEDIDPKFYMPFIEADLQDHTRKLDHLVEYTAEGARRDPFEYNLLQEYYTEPNLKDVPLLGICRGMQMMSVALHIPLYVDIKTELGIPNRRNLYDQINIIDPDSLMQSLFPVSFNAYKNHHQGLRVAYFEKYRDRWPHVQMTSVSNQGKIAESIELTDRPALGIQFHAEADNNSVRQTVFTWFLKQTLLKKKNDLE